MGQAQQTCECCGKPLIRKRYPGGRLEANSSFRRRKHCSLACANTKRPEAREKRRQQAAELQNTETITASQRTVQMKTGLEVLEEIMNNESIDWPTRISAAKAVLPYQARKVSAVGKKEARADAAEKAAATGRFAPGPEPKILPFNRRQNN